MSFEYGGLFLLSGLLGVALIISLAGTDNIKSTFGLRHFRLLGISETSLLCGHLPFAYQDAR